ncbi:MAG: hypothetical protein J1F35_07660 [Erysipelotrichales bacterium]|nr:hypothetical protein [Erysipelotrichales bacterium]
MYKIKSKIIDGKEKFGIIDDNLTVLAEFKYKDISPIEGSQNEFILTSFNGRKSFFEEGCVINTKYTEITPIPSEICGYSGMFIGRNSKSVDLFSIHKKYMKEELELYIFDSKKIFGSNSKVKIDDIRLESDGVCIYSNTEEGKLKGYFGHKILGHLEPKYVDVKSYSYETVKPYIPKFNEDEYYTTWAEKDWESRYAIVTKMVRGKLKKGIIIRTKGEYRDKWEELIPCKYDDIIPQDNGDFITINKKNKKTQKGIIHMTTYYDMYTKGSNIYGEARLQKEFELEPQFDEIKRLAENNAEFKTESDYIYYIVKKNGKFGLYKARTMKARGNFDTCDNHRPYGPLIEKMLDCEYDSIESVVSKLRLKNYERRYFTESFEATKGEKSLLIFDKKDINDDYVKTECDYKDVYIHDDNHYHANYILTDEAGYKQFATYEAIPETVKSWQPTKYQLKLTPKYKKAYINSTNSNTYLLIGEYEDDKVDVFTHYEMKQKCNRVDSFKKEEYFCISKKTIEEDGEPPINSLSVYNKSCEFIHEFKGNDITYSYSDKTYSVYVNVDGRVYIVDLSREKVVDGEFTYIDIIDEFMMYEQESGCGLNRLTKDGLVKILEPIYASVEILLTINRAIVSIKDENGNIKYGVKETNKGNNCIDVIYDSVTFDNEKFVCTLGTQTLYFDLDGFAIAAPAVLKCK